jgi:predicted dipeptidase
MIFGTDEESNWTGMKRYFEVEPAPTYGFSPDASFPLINGEKGNVSLKLNFDATATGTVTLTRFDAGLRPNMVPGKATASVHTTAAHQMASAFDDYLAEQPVSGSAHVDGDNVNFEVIGKAAHGMEPEKGNNAGTYLAQFLMQFDFAAAAHDFLTILGRDLHLDTRLHNLKMNFVDEIMGELTVNVGIMRYDAQVGGMIDLNFRYPKGLSADALVEQLTVATTGQQLTITRGDAMEPHYVDPQDPIVQTLMNAYRDQTGDVDSQPEVVGGGTYGRMMTRGVAFGALFPDTTNTMHQANEFQPVNQLVLSMAIYMQAIYELSVKK